MSSVFTRISAIAVIADRTVCSILTLYSLWSEHLDLWIKNPFAVSPRIQQLLRICVRNPQSAHLCCNCSRRLQPGPWPQPAVAVPCVIVDKRAVSIRLVYLSPLDTYGVSHSVFVVHFVAKRYILEQKCLKGQMGTCVLGTRWCNF